MKNSKNTTETKKILVIVDMQNDFITGSLGSPLTQAVVPKLVKKLEKHGKEYSTILLTRDIHFENYMDTLEGKKLPVPHCISGDKNKGEMIVKEVWDAVSKLRESGVFVKVFDKHTFASTKLIDYLAATASKFEIEFVGVCTDICVVSNAIGLRAALPNTVIKVDDVCCAGTTMKAHNAALRTMASCQIDIGKRVYGKKSEESVSNEPVSEEVVKDSVQENEPVQE